MRKISIQSFVFFFLLVIFSLLLSYLLIFSISTVMELDLLFLMGLFILFLYMISIFLFRILLVLMPIKVGYIVEGSKDEFYYNIYLLYKLIFFFPIIRTKLTPVPLTRLIYILLGAKLGSNTYSGGTILDPHLTIIGSNTIIGEDALLFSHAIEGRHLSHAFIKIGNNATIGAKSIIMSDVIIGDGSIVAAGSVVLKKTRIGPNEIWGGNPAKLIRAIKE